MPIINHDVKCTLGTNDVRKRPYPPDISGQLRRLVIRICLHFVTFVSFCSKSSFLFASSENGGLVEVHTKVGQVGQVGQVPIFIGLLHVSERVNNFETVFGKIIEYCVLFVTLS